jgi:hypothetical protein
MAHHLMIEPESAPDDILDASQVEEETFFYVPCFLGEGSFVCHWSASFGFDRQEPYTAYENYTDSRGNSRQRAVTKYRTVTDWRPASGTARGQFKRICCASDRESVPAEVAEMLENSLPLSKTVPYEQLLMGGYAAFDFAKGPDDGGNYIHNLVNRHEATEAAYSHAKGDRQKDWAIDADISFNGPVKAGFVPLGKFVFSYKGQNYSIFAEGASLRAQTKSGMPVDSARAKTKAAGYRPFWIAFLTSLIGGGLVYVEALSLSSNFLFWLAGAFGLTYFFGLIRSKSISGYSRKVRAASLAAKKLETTDNSGQPLSEGERQHLLAVSQPPVKPYFAKTDGDGLNFIVVIVAALIFLAVGFNVPSIFNGLLSSPPSSSVSSRSGNAGSSQAANVPQQSTGSDAGRQASSSASVSGGSSASGGSRPSSGSAQSSGSSSSAGFSSTSRSESSPGRSEGGAAARGAQTVMKSGNYSIYDLRNLVCLGQAKTDCRDQSGQLVDGIVFEVQEGRGGKKTLKNLAFYNRGRPDGTTVLYDSEQRLSKLVNYDAGIMNGLAIELHPVRSDMGQKIARIVPLNNNRIHGEIIDFDAQGRLIKSSVYSFGQLDGLTRLYHPDGSVKSKEIFEAGSSRGFSEVFEPGQLKEDLPKLQNMEVYNKILNQTNELSGLSAEISARL